MKYYCFCWSAGSRLPCWCHLLLLPHCLIPPQSDTLVLRKHTTHVPSLGLLHSLFPLPGKLYVQMSICMTDALISFESLVQISSPVWSSFLDDRHKITTAPNTLLPVTLLYFSVQLLSLLSIVGTYLFVLSLSAKMKIHDARDCPWCITCLESNAWLRVAAQQIFVKWTMCIWSFLKGFSQMGKIKVFLISQSLSTWWELLSILRETKIPHPWMNERSTGSQMSQ